MKTVLVFEPLIPLALWAALALAAIGLLAWYGRDCLRLRRVNRRRAPAILALMAVAVALPLAILLNPMWLERIPPPEGKPRLSVLLDASASMATSDAAGGQSRFDQARKTIAGLEDLRSQYDLEVRTFSGSTSPAEMEELAATSPEGSATDLANAIDDVLHADPLPGQAIVLLSDGIHNAGGGDARVVESARRARAMSAPIYSKVLGGDASVRDLALEVRTPQELAFVGQSVPIRALLESRGLDQTQARVSLVLDDELIDQREIVLERDRSQELEFEVRHNESGVFRYELRVDPVAGEATLANNSCPFVLRVIDEPVRVLLLEGKPYWDTKFLMRTLAADPSIELVSIVRMSPTRLLQRTLKRAGADGAEPAAAPPAQEPSAEPAAEDSAQPKEAAADKASPKTKARNEQWKILTGAPQVLADGSLLSNYQVVVLGRDAESYLSDEALVQLKRWLRDGGSLVCFRGPPTSQINQRLAQILPVRYSAARESRFRVKLTDAGKQLHWLPADSSGAADVLTYLPSLSMTSQPSNPPLQASTWVVGEAAAGQSPPVVTSLPYGTGHVVMVEGAGMWRWAFLAPQFQQHERIYGSLWHSLMRWLVSNTGLLPSQKWALRSDKIRFDATEPAAAVLLLRENVAAEDLPKIELTGDGLAEPQSLAPLPSGEEPGAYRVAFGKLPEGHYQARIAGSEPGDIVARTMFDVRSNVDEILQLKANPGLMKRVAEKSGGAALGDATAGEISRQLAEHLARSRPEQVRTTSAWDRWWVLASVFVMWCGSWGLRRWTGLV